MPEAEVRMVDIGKVTAADRKWCSDIESDCDSAGEDIGYDLKSQDMLTPSKAAEFDEGISQLPAVRSPLKKFAKKVGKDSNGWMEAYLRLKSAVGNLQTVKEVMGETFLEVGELIRNCSDSPTAAAILKPGLDSPKHKLAKIRQELEDGTENRPAAGLCRM